MSMSAIVDITPIQKIIGHHYIPQLESTVTGLTFEDVMNLMAEIATTYSSDEDALFQIEEFVWSEFSKDKWDEDGHSTIEMLVGCWRILGDTLWEAIGDVHALNAAVTWSGLEDEHSGCFSIREILM